MMTGSACNAGTQPINVGGMYLTDDPETPAKWRFPTDRSTVTTIPAGGYLLIWADGDTTGRTGLHAGFRLNAGGDTVALIDADGKTILDMVQFDQQTADVSYGRDPAATDQWRLLGFPTPGASNINTYAGFVGAVLAPLTLMLPIFFGALLGLIMRSIVFLEN
jgi:hypothetical protein